MKRKRMRMGPGLLAPYSLMCALVLACAPGGSGGGVPEESAPNPQSSTWGYWQGTGNSLWYVSDAEVRYKINGNTDWSLTWNIVAASDASIRATLSETKANQAPNLVLERKNQETMLAKRYKSGFSGTPSSTFSLVKAAGKEIVFTGKAGSSNNALPAKAIGFAGAGSIILVVQNLNNASDIQTVTASTTQNAAANYTVTGAIPTDRYKISTTGFSALPITVTPQHDGAQVGEFAIDAPYSIKASSIEASTQDNSVYGRFHKALIKGRSSEISVTMSLSGTAPEVSSSWMLYFSANGAETQIGTTQNKQLGGTGGINGETFTYTANSSLFSSLDIPDDPGYLDLPITLKGWASESLIYTDTQSLRLFKAVEPLTLVQIRTGNEPIASPEVFVVTPDRRFEQLPINTSPTSISGFDTYVSRMEVLKMKGDYHIAIVAPGSLSEGVDYDYRLALGLTGSAVATGMPTYSESESGDLGATRATATPLNPGDILSGFPKDGEDVDCLKIAF